MLTIVINLCPENNGMKYFFHYSIAPVLHYSMYLIEAQPMNRDSILKTWLKQIES